MTDVQRTPILALIEQLEVVAQNQYSNSVEFTVSTPVGKGELLNFELISDGGAILTPAGRLFIFNADPALTAGDVALTVAQRKTIVGEVPVVASDWDSDTNAASVDVPDRPMVFQASASLWAAWRQLGATGFNSSTTDLESLNLHISYRTE